MLGQGDGRHQPQRCPGSSRHAGPVSADFFRSSQLPDMLLILAELALQHFHSTLVSLLHNHCLIPLTLQVRQRHN